MKATKRGIAYEEFAHESTLAWGVKFDRSRGPVWIYWQSAPVPEVGRTGFQPEELLELVAERLRQLNVPPLNSRETSLAITHIEEAILWLEERTRDRVARGVEGTHVP